MQFVSHSVKQMGMRRLFKEEFAANIQLYPIQSVKQPTN